MLCRLLQQCVRLEAVFAREVTSKVCCLCINANVNFTDIIIIIIDFVTSQLWLGNIPLSWDVVINRIRLGGLICSLKSFLQLNMCQELQIFAAVCMYWGAG